jgi:hypothetical protein
MGQSAIVHNRTQAVTYRVSNNNIQRGNCGFISGDLNSPAGSNDSSKNTMKRIFF